MRASATRRRPRRGAARPRGRRGSRPRARDASSRSPARRRPRRSPRRSGRRGRARSSSVAPAPVFVTFLTGQPKLTSTMSAPAATTMRADSPIACGSEPKSWIAERVLVGRDAQVAERSLVAVLDPRAADHLGADETCAEAAALASERLHADAGHRRQDEPGRDLDRADPPRLAEVDLHARHGTARCATPGRSRRLRATGDRSSLLGSVDHRPPGQLPFPPCVARRRRAVPFTRVCLEAL